MNFQISPDRCYCSFGNGLVYEFVPFTERFYKNSCWKCAFYQHRECLAMSLECVFVPCQSGVRRDKTEGFWQICKSLDYQAFTKMLQNGG
jgi:hypothetical protein